MAGIRGVGRAQREGVMIVRKHDEGSARAHQVMLSWPLRKRRRRML